MDIATVTYLQDFVLAGTFSDGSAWLLDFAPYLQQSRNPLVLPYREPAAFARVRVDYGALCWENNMDFSGDTIYHWNETGQMPEPNPTPDWQKLGLMVS